MSRKRRPIPGALDKHRPVLTGDTEQRLAQLVRRHGGQSRPIEAGYRLLDPPRGECDGQLDLFDPEQYVPYELRGGPLG